MRQQYETFVYSSLCIKLLLLIFLLHFTHLYYLGCTQCVILHTSRKHNWSIRQNINSKNNINAPKSHEITYCISNIDIFCYLCVKLLLLIFFALFLSTNVYFGSTSGKHNESATHTNNVFCSLNVKLSLSICSFLCTNVTRKIFDYKIIFVNSQHKNTNSKGNFVLKIRF